MDHDDSGASPAYSEEDLMDATGMTRGDVTRLLSSWRRGRLQALDDVVPLVYEELLKIAASYLRRERPGYAFDEPTALVHEAFVRLVTDNPPRLVDRTHFFALTARSMRRVLVDHARRQAAKKRISKGDQVALDDSPEPATALDLDVIALNEALGKLAEVNTRQAQLVELRYFGGLTNLEAAEVLDVSAATVERDWQTARQWLQRRLGS